MIVAEHRVWIFILSVLLWGTFVVIIHLFYSIGDWNWALDMTNKVFLMLLVEHLFVGGGILWEHIYHMQWFPFSHTLRMTVNWPECTSPDKNQGKLSLRITE